MSIQYAELARVHSSTGANGGTVSGATNATPIVITTSAAHNLQDGDQVQITGVGGNTNANTTAYAKVTGYSTTTFGLYSNSLLTTAIAGNSAYTAGGAVSEALDVSGVLAPWTIRLRVEGMTAGATALISIQDSADGFVNDVKSLAVVNVAGAITDALGAEVEHTWPGYMLPSARIGVMNGRLRVYVQTLTGTSPSVTTTLGVQS